MYIPEQGDIVWANFNPTRGKEIQKERPALVISTSQYQKKTGFAIVLPITSTIRQETVYYTLNGYQTHGQVVTVQIRSLDYTPQAHRNFKFVEKMKAYDFLQIAQLVENYFNFNGYEGI